MTKNNNTTQNTYAESITKMTDFLKKNGIVVEQAEIATKIGFSSSALSQAKNHTYNNIKTAEKIEAAIKAFYGLSINSEGEVESILPIEDIPNIPTKTPLETIWADIKSFMLQRQTLYLLVLCFVVNRCTHSCDSLLSSETSIENSIDSIGKNGVYFNKALNVNKDSVTVGFLGDYGSTNIGGYSIFRNAHKRSIAFIGTYYRQNPALVLYNGDPTVPKKDRETYFIGQTAKDIWFQGTFYRIPDVGGSLISVDSSGQRYVHTTTAYDKCVVGILSDEVGEISNNQVKTEERIIAFSGVVKVRVSIAGGNIATGDLLTSSNTEGVAMKANLNNPKAVGSIIAKALEPYNAQNEGKIRVMIMQK